MSYPGMILAVDALDIIDTEYLLRPEHMTQQLKSNVYPKLPGYAYTWAPVVAYIGIGIYAGMDFYKRVYLVNAHVSPYEPVAAFFWAGFLAYLMTVCALLFVDIMLRDCWHMFRK